MKKKKADKVLRESLNSKNTSKDVLNEAKKYMQEQNGDSQMAKSKKWLVPLATCCLVVMAFSVVLAFYLNRPNISVDIPSSSANLSESEQISGSELEKVLPTYKDIYLLNDNSSFTEVELLEIGEIYKADNSNFSSNLIMLKFKVIEDYYKKISKNTVLTVPISLQFKNVETKKQEELPKETIEEFFVKNKKYFLYVSKVNDKNSYFNVDIKNYEQLQNVSNIVSINSLSLIPINNDDKVALNDLTAFLKNLKIVSIDDLFLKSYIESGFFVEDMSVEDARNNVKNLYSEFLANNL